MNVLFIKHGVLDVTGIVKILELRLKMRVVLKTT